MMRVEIDWTGVYEDVTDDVMRLAWSLGMRQPYQTMADESTCEIVLRNDFGKYLPEQVGYVQPRRPIRISMGSTVMWTGYLDYPEIDWSPGPVTGKRRITLHGVGEKQRLASVPVALPLYTSVTGDAVVRDVLDAAGITASAIQTGATTIDTYGDRESASAYAALRDITEAERGRFFINRSGVATWWNRHHLLTRTVRTATVYTSTGAYQPVALDYSYGQAIANAVRVEVDPRKQGSGEILWELNTTVTVPAGQTRTFQARLRRPNGEFAGAGSLTPAAAFSSGSAAVTVTPQGGTARVTVDNGAGIQPAVLSGLTLTGAPTINQHQIIVEREDSASIAAYGKRGLRLRLPLGDYAGAESVAHFELSRRKDPSGTVASLTYRRPSDGTANAHQIAWTVGVRLRLFATELNHNADYFITGESHRWRPNIHETVFRLEPAASSTFWILGDSLNAVLGSSTRLAY